MNSPRYGYIVIRPNGRGQLCGSSIRIYPSRDAAIRCIEQLQRFNFIDFGPYKVFSVNYYTYSFSRRVECVSDYYVYVDVLKTAIVVLREVDI